MRTVAYLAEAGLLDLSLSFVIEIIAFILMVLLLWFGIPFLRIPSAYRMLMDAAEARQRAIAEQLREAERAREEAKQRLDEAEKRIDEARRQASEVIEAAGRSGEQLRAELRERGEEERKRMVEQAQREIGAAREQAVHSVREEVAGLVVAATEKVIGESLDDQKHKKLIDEAIREVTGGDGRR
jgi:F-type H+-transporting ATPase subunit b